MSSEITAASARPVRWGLAAKLFAILVLLGAVAVLVSGVLGYMRARDALQESIYNQLTAVRKSKARQIETYFRTIRDELSQLAAAKMTIDAARAFRAGFDELEQFEVPFDLRRKAGEAVLSPMSIASHDIVDLLDRQLRDQHGDDDPLLDHRRRHKGGGCTARGRVGGEILEAHGRPVGRGATAGNGSGDIGGPVGASPEGRGEIDFLVYRVDQTAGLGVGQHDIEEAEGGCGAPQKWMVESVLPAIGAAVARIVHQLALILRIRIDDDVVVLEIVGGGSFRQVVIDV